MKSGEMKDVPQRIEEREDAVSEHYLLCDQAAFVFDRDSGLLFRLDGSRRIEVRDLEQLRRIRLKGVEIPPRRARSLSPPTSLTDGFPPAL